jgi:hypothetical protein
MPGTVRPDPSTLGVAGERGSHHEGRLSARPRLPSFPELSDFWRRRLAGMSTDDDARWENRTGLTFAIDNHIVDGTTPAEVELRRLHTEGWIELVLTDVTRTEWVAADPEKRQQLEDLAIGYAEYHGPAVWGHFRWGSAVWGGAEDRERLERVFAALVPGTDLKSGRAQDVRDAMNVATAIRYGTNGFITRDGIGKDRGVLHSAGAIKAAFDDFSILSPEQALAFVERTMRGWQAVQLKRSPPVTGGQPGIPSDPESGLSGCSLS